MLHQLAQPNSTGVRTHRHTELRCHQYHGEVLVDAAKTAAVDLTKADRIRLQQLLEQHAIGAMLARGHAHRRHRARDHVLIRHPGSSALDPQQVEFRQGADLIDGFIDIPALVGVDHQRAIRADGFAHETNALVIVFGTRAHLDLEVRPAGGNRIWQAWRMRSSL